jgi:DNA-binding transcriptional ArsR family regulator
MGAKSDDIFRQQTRVLKALANESRLKIVHRLSKGECSVGELTDLVGSDRTTVPMYSNAAGIIPIVQAFLGKRAALGTVLAFMMSVISLSLTEMVILRRVLKVPLIATFAGVVALGILLVGYLFNIVL